MRCDISRRGCPAWYHGAMVWLSLLLSSACGPSADYGLSPPTAANPAGWDTIFVVADVALQRGSYGAEVGRCQVQVAFEPVLYGDSTAEDDPPAGEPWTVNIPDEPGTCAFTEEPLPDEGSEAGDAGDNWYVSGSLDGPPWVELQGSGVDLVLEPVEAEDGRVRYELPPDLCTDEDFPVGQVFDLVVPEGERADSMPGFTVLEALAVGPDVYLTSPSIEDLDTDRVSHPVGDDLDVAWELAGDLPVVAGDELAPEIQLKLYNQDEEHELPSEWLVCLPEDDGAFTVSADELAALTVNPSEGEDRWYASVTVHSSTTTPPFETPWGEPVQLRAHVSEGGFVLFHD